MKIPHPIPYQGSKRNLANQILKFFPKNIPRLVEPFAGSAAISIAAAYYFKADNFTDGDTASFNFIIKQISTSRKEVRLKLRDIKISNNSQVITDITNQLNNNIDESNLYFMGKSFN